MQIDRTFGNVTILRGEDGGRYPHGNTMLIRGRRETVLVDPSLSIASDPNPPDGVDRLLISHCHEDHIASVFRYPQASIHVHKVEIDALRTLDGLMAIYGMPSAEMDARWRKEVVERFHYTTRLDARPFEDSDVFDLGGATVRVVHLPGHTHGHSGFFVEPAGVMFLADIDLTGFGPYYGDAASSLDDFEDSIQRCRDIDAQIYATFHHKGVIEGRDALRAALDEYEAVIGRRERALLEMLVEPLTLDDIVARRFIYRPHVKLLFVDAVERRSAELHLERLLRAGAVKETEAGRYIRSRG